MQQVLPQRITGAAWRVWQGGSRKAYIEQAVTGRLVLALSCVGSCMPFAKGTRIGSSIGIPDE